MTHFGLQPLRGRSGIWVGLWLASVVRQEGIVCGVLWFTRRVGVCSYASALHVQEQEPAQSV
jgi:hypothetical protein